jgi:hypothetical protein
MTPIHQHIFLLEPIIRFIEEKIRREENDNSDTVQECCNRLRKWGIQYIQPFQDERIVVQRACISTGLLLFGITCRFELYMHEPSWRETSSHLRIEDIAGSWIEEDFIEENPDPILFISCSKLCQYLQLVQKNWYSREWNPDVVRLFLKWLERRMSLLITFEFDDETFDLDQYRQKQGNGSYLCNMGLIYDAYAYFSCYARDLERFERYKPHIEEHDIEKCDESTTYTLLRHIIENVQGDSISIDFAKLMVEHSVRVADRLIFKRRRPEVIGANDMEVLTECSGRQFAEKVHKAADCILKDEMENKVVVEVLWFLVIRYYFQQKVSFPIQKECFMNRYDDSFPYPKTIDELGEYPKVMHVPIINLFGVVYKSKILIFDSQVQAFLQWMRIMKEDFDATYKYKAKNYFLRDVIDEFLTSSNLV